MLVIGTVEGSPMRGLRAFAQVYGIVVGVLIGIFLIAYPLFILVKGGRYAILFEMDAKGVRHIEMPSTVDRSELLAWVGVVAGLAARNPTVMGSNPLALSRKEMYTRFKDVRKVVVLGRKRVIKLISRDMTRDLIYAGADDFASIEAFVLRQCRPDESIVRR